MSMSRRFDARAAADGEVKVIGGGGGGGRTEGVGVADEVVAASVSWYVVCERGN